MGPKVGQVRKELVCYCKTDLSPQSPRLDTAPMWPTFWRHLTQNTIWAMATAGIILCLFLDVSRILFVPYGTRSCAGKGVSLRTGLRELKSFTESGCRPEGNSRRSLSSPTSNTRKDQYKQHRWLSSLLLCSGGGGHWSYSYWSS